MSIQVISGTITLSTTSGGTVWTMAAGAGKDFNNRNFANASLFFDGTGVVEIMEERGIGG